MADFELFEQIVRDAHNFTEAAEVVEGDQHPFEFRNIHPDLPPKVRKLFDDGYYPESTFEAFKFVEKRVKKLSSLSLTGWKLMMAAFDEGKPVLKLNACLTESEIDEQKGFRYIFAGAQAGIRNPRGHETDLVDSPDLCLDHLSVASVLLRTIDSAGLTT